MRIFSTLFPASFAPAANSSQRMSEFPPLRGEEDIISTFLFIVFSFVFQIIVKPQLSF